MNSENKLYHWLFSHTIPWTHTWTLSVFGELYTLNCVYNKHLHPGSLPILRKWHLILYINVLVLQWDSMAGGGGQCERRQAKRQSPMNLKSANDFQKVD